MAIFAPEMKIFAFFIAILVLVLSVMPCADGASAMQGKKVTVVTLKKDVSNNETGDDNCSPFCQCACCAGFSISHPITSVEFVLTHSTSRFFPFSSNYVTGIALPIWQPPQLLS
ncbi:MAG: hypothetical protein EOO06_05325 [Chitinophagaceae bacterium]|nr:MAG: hypothetical protein EOO06_05325 [Chitinophagaceae bacterium]